MTRVRALLAIAAILMTPLAVRGADRATVHVESANPRGPRPLRQRTAAAVVRDYLQSWQALKTAFKENSVGALSPEFVGTALEKLTNAIHQQAALGIQTRYRDRAHDIRIVFYSPEGLSVELTDRVTYDQQVLRGGKVLASRRLHARYIVVVTPAEARWRVRVFQADPESSP